MVEASKYAANYGLYSKQGFRTIDTYDYVDKQRFPGFEGMYIVTMARDTQDTYLRYLVCSHPQPDQSYYGLAAEMESL